MPRFRRPHLPGSAVHVIWRFVNHDIRLTCDAERRAVLDRLAVGLRRTDWRPCGWALMGSHIHLAMLAGNAPAAALLKPLGVSLAHLLNLAQGRFGPVLAERASTIHMPPHRLGPLLAYIHNNPVRAGLADDPRATTWTSHAALCGHSSSPPWLDGASVLHAAGFEATEAGRAEFHDYVVARLAEDLDEGEFLPEVRARIRDATGLPVELGSPVESPADTRLSMNDLFCRGAIRRDTLTSLDRDHVLALLAIEAGVPIDALRARTKARDVVSARRRAVAAGVLRHGLRPGEVASLLGLPSSTVSRFLRQSLVGPRRAGC